MSSLNQTVAASLVLIMCCGMLLSCLRLARAMTPFYRTLGLTARLNLCSRQPHPHSLGTWLILSGHVFVSLCAVCPAPCVSVFPPHSEHPAAPFPWHQVPVGPLTATTHPCGSPFLDSWLPALSLSSVPSHCEAAFLWNHTL